MDLPPLQSHHCYSCASGAHLHDSGHVRGFADIAAFGGRYDLSTLLVDICCKAL